MRLIHALCLLSLLATCSCASPPSPPASSTQTPAAPTESAALPAPTAVEAPPPTRTHEPTLDMVATLASIGATFEVSFDGTGCTTTGPGVVAPGGYVFKLINHSGVNTYLYVSRLYQTTTYQDVLDWMGVQGTYSTVPPGTAVLAFNTIAFADDVTTYKLFTLDIPSEYYITLEWRHEGQVGFWACGLFSVNSAP